MYVHLLEENTRRTGGEKEGLMEDMVDGRI